MSYEDFFHEYMQSIYSSSEAQNNYKEVQFTEQVCDFLVDQAIIENYAAVSYKKITTGIRVDAYDYSESGELTLVIADYRLQPETLIATDIEKNFKRVIKFFTKSLNHTFYQGLDESDQGFNVAREIYTYSSDIRKIKFILVSNAELSKRANTVPNSIIENIPCIFDVWDLGRIQRIEESGKSREDMIVDFSDIQSGGLPCLCASTGENTYESYLLAIPGEQIANLYDEYGERLLEQNVRTFLQFRGKVNKGMRNTIQNEPQMFFAFNNGITATAEEVATVTDNKLVKITKIKNLQIVNGGQTTASLFNSQQKNKADLAEVYVQVKLTVIPPEETEEIVPKISEYANTQNKVSAADFFSNHPYHLRIENISRRLWAPSPTGGLRETHWYYERVRGQYANAQANLTPAQKREFLVQNPRNQMFTKTDLAKFEGSWSRTPHTVSLGAQKNFVLFANNIAKGWDKNEKQFNELYYKELIAKAILFRFLDKSLMKQPWYGGYKANIVTYTLAKLSYLISSLDAFIDFELIWKMQALTEIAQRSLLEIAELVNETIQNTPEGITNVTEWCKKESCWENVINIDYTIDSLLVSELVCNDEQKNKENSAKAIQKIDNGIEAQKYVLNKGASYWAKVLDWSRELNQLSPKEQDILQVATMIPNRFPSEKQAALIIRIENKMVEEGYSSTS